jgi:hypothetical protein
MKRAGCIKSNAPVDPFQLIQHEPVFRVLVVSNASRGYGERAGSLSAYQHALFSQRLVSISI